MGLVHHVLADAVVLELRAAETELAVVGVVQFKVLEDAAIFLVAEGTGVEFVGSIFLVLLIKVLAGCNRVFADGGAQSARFHFFNSGQTPLSHFGIHL